MSSARRVVRETLPGPPHALSPLPRPASTMACCSIFCFRCFISTGIGGILINWEKGMGQIERSAAENEWREASWRERGKGGRPGTRDGWVWWCWVMAWLTWQRCMSACYVTTCCLFFLALGGVIAYISSSSSASSPASCHSESSDSGFQSSSSPVPSSPNSSSSEGGCNSRSSEGSDGAPKSDRLEETIKTNQSSVAGLTKGHNGVTSMFGAGS